MGASHKVSVDLLDENFAHADGLRAIIGRTSSRIEVIRRALALMYWACVTKEGDELVVLRKGREVGRMRWADPKGE